MLKLAKYPVKEHLSGEELSGAHLAGPEQFSLAALPGGPSPSSGTAGREELQ